MWSRRAACVASLRVVAWAQDWPQWRGPFGTGVSPETGLPTQRSRDENIAWTAPLPGLGAFSPIVWGDRVFVTFHAAAMRSRRPPAFVQGSDSVIREENLCVPGLGHQVAA